MEPLLGQLLKDHFDRAVTEAPPSSGQPVAPKDQLLLAIARFICLANEILAAYGPALKCEAANQAYEKCNEAIKKGCAPPYPPVAYTPYPPPAAQAATGGPSGSPADVWRELARLLQMCSCAAQQWMAGSYKRQPYTEPEEQSTKATEEERKPASHAPKSGQK